MGGLSPVISQVVGCWYAARQCNWGDKVNETNISLQEATALYYELEESHFGESPQQKSEIERFISILDDTPSFADIGASLTQYSYNAN